MMRLGYLGLGSNVGDRRANLQAAVEELWTHGVMVLASSSAYETEPVGEVLDQREFLNACVRIETELEPEPLLDVCKAVERALGREPGGVRHGPRPIDVDLLLLEDVEYESERLRLPHREVMTRRFVLVPLLELDPDLPGAAAALAALEAPGGPARRPAARRAWLALASGETYCAAGGSTGARSRRRGAGGDLLRRHDAPRLRRPAERWPRRSRRRLTRRGSTRSAIGRRTDDADVTDAAGEPVRVVGAGRRVTELSGRVDLGEDRSSVAALTVRGTRWRCAARRPTCTWWAGSGCGTGRRCGRRRSRAAW